MTVSDTSDTEPFNPHGEKTFDGVVVTLGMRVTDYDRKVGTVVADRDATDYSCPAHPGYRFPDNEHHGCHNGWRKPTHWFDVKRDDGTVGMFDGSRLHSI
jgi:hypothetical protein